MAADERRSFGVPFAAMHEDFGADAGREPDPVERAYRLDVLLDGVPEAVAFALMQRIGDLLIEHGLATAEGGDVRAVICMQAQRWPPDLTTALHVLIPKAVPQSPDLGANYSPN